MSAARPTSPAPAPAPTSLSVIAAIVAGAIVGIAAATMVTGCRERAAPVEPRVEARAAPTPTPTPTPAAAAAEPAGRHAFYARTFAKRPTVAAMTEVGRLLFADPALSGSGKLACATCHDPANAYGPSNALAIQRGGSDGTRVGTRATPSLRYLQTVPRFTEHFHDSDGDDGADQGPAGGLTWDGRAQSAHDQAQSPLFSPLEMANASPHELIARVRAAPYADRLRATFGDNVLDDDDRAEKAVLLALEVFQQSPADFYPYDSKYDAVLRGTATLTPAEARGLDLFESPTKGNCARCHPSTIKEGGFPAFTDFGYIALGVPRNPKIPANADPAYFDLGLCGPLRTDLVDHPEYCGMFRTPSLRNVTRRHRFFHNGAFDSLERVVQFYATRDVAPERWYRRGAKYDDLPPAARRNVDVDAPFGGKPGGAPALDAAEIADVIAFLHTLEDGAR